jgi:3-methyladenine DNA glycosylase Mpg
MRVVDAAKALVGCTLEHGDTAGVIVETEAYHEQEPASHSYIGLTPRSRVLFEAPGRLYVYRSYGIHALANVVAMKSRPSRLPEVMRATSPGVNRSASFSTVARASSVVNARWSLARTDLPVALSV